MSHKHKMQPFFEFSAGQSALMGRDEFVHAAEQIWDKLIKNVDDLMKLAIDSPDDYEIASRLDAASTQLLVYTQLIATGNALTELRVEDMLMGSAGKTDPVSLRLQEIGRTYFDFDPNEFVDAGAPEGDDDDEGPSGLPN